MSIDPVERPLEHSLEAEKLTRLINECREIMVMSDTARDELDQHYKVPSHTEVRKIYHGHYIDCYKNEVSREEARKRLNIDQKAFVYLGNEKTVRIKYMS